MGRRSKAENGRDYGPSGLGIDTSLNDRYYDWCKAKAVALGLAAEWDKAEADYRQWLTEAMPLKARLEKAKQVAMIQFDEDQKGKASALREHEIRSMKRQLRLDLHPAIFSGKEMEDLSRAHKLDTIAGMIVDGYQQGGVTLTLGRVIEVAKAGLKALIDFLSEFFEYGFGLRLPIGDRLDDPDYRADVSSAVAAEVEVAKKSFKPEIRVERHEVVRTEVKREIVERKVFIEVEPEGEWEWRRWVLKTDHSLAAPLIRDAAKDEALGELNWKDPKWAGKRAPYVEQLAIVDAAVARRRAAP